MQYCKPVSILSKEKQKTFIVKYCSILKNRSKDQVVCNICLKDIKQNKVPKRSHRSAFKFANFPRYLIQNFKKICKVNNNNLNTLILDEENQDRQALKLNRLEAYLLKLVIPSIRIAHCPRGPYLKLKGDLILISSDIGHSLSKILPVQQSIIPVCFKRKLSYTGSYIEEYVEKDKVKKAQSSVQRYNIR